MLWPVLAAANSVHIAGTLVITDMTSFLLVLRGMRGYALTAQYVRAVYAVVTWTTRVWHDQDGGFGNRGTDQARQLS